jgi:hypothetical protein
MKAQPYERVRRRWEFLCLPRSLTHHRNQLPPGINTALRYRQQLRRPRPGGYIKRHQRPVSVRGQPSEDLVEFRIRDTAGNPLGHPRSIQPSALVAMGLHRIVMRMRPTAAPGPIQWKRIHHRPRTDVAVKVVEAPQHGLAMHPHRHRVRRSRRARRTARTPRAVSDRDPPAEIAGFRPGRPVPSNSERPQEPEPAQQVHPVRADGRLAAPSSQQITEERCDCPNRPPRWVDQPIRLPLRTGHSQRPHRRNLQHRKIPHLVQIVEHGTDRKTVHPTKPR